MRVQDVAAALSSSRRLRILAWLKDPEANFPPQVEGDLALDGVCGLFLARKLRITQASASEHLRILVDLGLLRSKRIKQWTFYRRDERRIAAAKRVLQGSL
jgi:DNA-binding transcriptional ArsR family regulator